MSLNRCRLTLTAVTLVVAWCFQGCAQETPAESGPMSGGHSNTTVSGYLRYGVMFPGR